MSLRLPTWEELSKDEQVPIANLPLNNSFIVTGGPGTGKTILALHRAAKLKASSSQVNFLVYNKTLRNYLEQAISEAGLNEYVVKTWHSWFYNYYQGKIGNLVPEVSSYNPNWVIIEEESSLTSNKIFDHLIIDEAQDLPIPLLKILRKISNNITAFADENQSIEDESTNISEIINALETFGRRYFLSRNYRNTQEIYDVAKLFYTGDVHDIPAKCYKSGDKPSIIKCDFHQIVDYIATYADNNPSSNIGVLLPRIDKIDKYYNSIKNKSTYATVQVYHYRSNNNFDFEKDGVKILSFGSAKGLEFDTVFLPEIDNDLFSNSTTKMKNRIYVCCTRAKENLIFTYQKENYDSFILSTLFENNDLLEWLKF